MSKEILQFANGVLTMGGVALNKPLADRDPSLDDLPTAESVLPKDAANVEKADDVKTEDAPQGDGETNTDTPDEATKADDVKTEDKPKVEAAPVEAKPVAATASKTAAKSSK